MTRACIAITFILALVACGSGMPDGGNNGNGSTASSQCWYPNWESDCGSSSDCDPGLSCTAACPSCSQRCHGVSCSSDADCSAAYGSQTKNGRTYCASHCGSDGTCQF
jgi:hypothetical protein